jgi:hypothetical protein
MLQPRLAFCCFATGFSGEQRVDAARTSAPVTGTSVPGRDASNWPR